MKKSLFPIVALTALLFLSVNAYADCRGCCSGHGGLICINGITRCGDGTPLSQKCVQKGCNVCPEKESTATPTEITIASFNIQVFGRAKASKAEVMEILADTISQFDIVAVQEIRDRTGTAIKDLEVEIDNLGVDYDYIIGPRLGRTSSKEQYAFFYKTPVISVQGSYTYDDSANDHFHREPFIGKFSVSSSQFDFCIVNIHTDPDDATDEINALPSVITDAQSRFGDTDVILLGDLNADCSYFDEDSASSPLNNSEYRWRITNAMDTNLAASSCTYDRIITTPTLDEDYAGNAGVFRFDLEFELDCEPKEVSDHYPVYCDFHVESDTD